MKKSIITALVVANVTLGGTLAWRATSNVATAQPLPTAPVPGKYMLIPGYSSALNASIVYVFDSNNRRLGGIAPDSREQFSSMQTIALDPIFKAAEASRQTNEVPRARPGRGPGAR